MTLAGTESREMPKEHDAGESADKRARRRERDNADGDGDAPPDTAPEDAEISQNALFNGDDRRGDEDSDELDDLSNSIKECAVGAQMRSPQQRLDEHYPTNEVAEEAAQKVVTDFYGRTPEVSIPRDAEGRFIDPIASINNVGQRTLIFAVMAFFLKLHAWASSGEKAAGAPMPEFRAIVVGVAGTGKSFVMKLIAACCTLFVCQASASAVFAPTGAASGSVGAPTPDRALSMSRGADKFSDVPKAKLSGLQQFYKHTLALLLDEARF